MLDQNEQRQQIRIALGSEVTIKMADNNQPYLGRCKSISGGGISFITLQELQPGKAAEIHIAKSTFGPPVTAFIEIVRCKQITVRSFEIAATIKSIKGC